jgi:hypothetical protein
MTPNKILIITPTNNNNLSTYISIEFKIFKFNKKNGLVLIKEYIGTLNKNHYLLSKRNQFVI